MPRIELELDDKGDMVGAIPPEVEALFKKVEAAAHDRGLSTGVLQATEKGKKQIADTIAAEKARLEAMAPLEKEKYVRTEEELASVKKQLLELSSSSDRTLKAREEAHARELLSRADAIAKREQRIRDAVKENIRSLALAAGARDESVGELEKILSVDIGYDDDMTPFVKDETGAVKTAHGKPISIPEYVKTYLDTHPHHKRAAQGQGGGARGGASFAGAGTVPTAEAAKARLHRDGPSADTIEDLYQATRKPSASG